jgi:hypothetical protein
MIALSAVSWRGLENVSNQYVPLLRVSGAVPRVRPNTMVVQKRTCEISHRNLIASHIRSQCCLAVGGPARTRIQWLSESHLVWRSVC